MENKSKKIRIDVTASTKNVESIAQSLNSAKMKVDRSFQRRVVWTPKVRNSFFESVSKGTAVSSVVVADIASGIEASLAVGDIEGAEKYKQYQAQGFRTVSEDGQNRLSTLEAFLADEVTFTGRLFDRDYCDDLYSNKLFSKLPEDVQHAFKTSQVVVVKVNNVPYKELSNIFIKLNDGMPLNAVEKRNAFATPIASYLRDLTGENGIYKDLWPLYMNPGKINRMDDIKWLSKALVCVNREVAEDDKDLSEKSIDSFYKKGIDRAQRDVKEYDKAELRRFQKIIDMVLNASQKQNEVNGKIPQKTFWALLYAAEYIYDNSLAVVDYAKLFEHVYLKDAELEEASKLEQASKLENFKKGHSHLSKSEIKKLTNDNSSLKDDNFYWRWVNRNDDYSKRRRRQKDLVDALSIDPAFNSQVFARLEEAA